MRIIDADKLFEWYKGQRTKYPVKKNAQQFNTLMMYEIFDEIDDAPSIDIVRCNECKYYKYDWCNLHDSTFISDDFCSYGERKCDE